MIDMEREDAKATLQESCGSVDNHDLKKYLGILDLLRVEMEAP